MFSTPEQAPDQRTRLKRLFLDHDGLRPAWGLFFFLLPPASLYALSRLIAHYFPLVAAQPSGAVTLRPLLTFATEAVAFLLLSLLTLILSLLERRSFLSYGLALSRALPDFARGLFWGFVMLSALIAGLFFTHAIAFHGLALHGLLVPWYAFKWLLAFLFVGLLEEFLFRGYLQTTLTRALAPYLPQSVAFWVAAAVFSMALFAWTHTGNGGETPWGIAAVALAGATFAFALFRTGSLWWAIGFHTTWDWGQSFFYGTPDSGNLASGHLFATNPTGNPLLSGASAGPEGSLLVIPTFLLTCLIIFLTLPKRPLVVLREGTLLAASPPTSAPNPLH